MRAVIVVLHIHLQYKLELQGNVTACDLNLSLVLVGVMKQYPILVEKIQLPGVREKKAEAMKIAE